MLQTMAALLENVCVQAQGMYFEGDSILVDE